jgi:clan AA aspartic protease
VAISGPQGREQEIEAIVDTGFTGALLLPPTVVNRLDLPFRRRGRALLADGSEVLFDVYEATVACVGSRWLLRIPIRWLEWPCWRVAS